MQFKSVTKHTLKSKGAPKSVSARPKKIQAKTGSSAAARLPVQVRFASQSVPVSFTLARATSAGAPPISSATQRAESGKCQTALIKAAPVKQEPAKAAPAPKPRKKRTAVTLRGDGYLRLAEVLTVYPVSRAAWYAGMAEGIYPPSTQLGKRSVGWSRASIRELIANPPKF